MNAKRSKRPSDPNTTAFTNTGYGEMPRPLENERLSSDRSTLTSEFKETAQAAGKAVREQAATFADDVSHELGKKVDEQKTRGIEGMRAFAQAIKTAAQELDEQSPQVARYVRDAADRVQSLSGNIEGRNITELMRSASDLAKSQPTMFFVGAVAAGFALSRFLKSSSHIDEIRRDDQSATDDDRAEVMESTGGIDYANP
jgi:hypothetical protein